MGRIIDPFANVKDPELKELEYLNENVSTVGKQEEIISHIDWLESKLDTLIGIDYATETKQDTIITNQWEEITLLWSLETEVQILNSVDFATEATLQEVKDNQTNWIHKTQITDLDWNIAVVDLRNKAIVQMDFEHHAVHIWEMFYMPLYSTVTNWTPKYCQLKTWDWFIHLKEKSIVDGDSTLLCTFIEAPSITDWTTPIPILNRNRNSSNTSSMIAYSNPTWVSWWTILDYDYLFWDSQWNSSFASWQQSMNLERILKPNTTYIYKLENLTAWTTTFLWKLMWYEHL